VAAYYNENDPQAAAWLRELMKKGLIADGEIDDRSIVAVSADDLRGFTHAHFFAGIGGWAHAARLAGWPDDRPLWTGSCPCQPFSVVGRLEGFSDERDLWPEWLRIIKVGSPDIVFGEQVAGEPAWLDRMSSDMEAEGYAVGAVVLPACAVDAPHRRDRAYFVAHAYREGLEGHWLTHGSPRRREEPDGHVAPSGFWGGAALLADADHWLRRVEPEIHLLADGFSAALAGVRAVEERVARELEASVRLSNRDPGEVLRMVRQHLQSEAALQRSAGGQGRVSSAEVLLHLLLCVEAARDRAAHGSGVAETLQEEHLWLLRSVWDAREIVDPPHRREPDEQRAIEPPDALPVVSLILAQHAEAHRDAIGGAHAALTRTMTLRGFGNAIVPQLAAAVMKCFL
jgi:DNA (cytosine-5)-methyltransferase 1